MVTRLRITSLLLLALIAAAAQAQPGETGPQTLDDLFEAVAQRVPEFGGMFLDPNGTSLYVVLIDINGQTIEAAEAAINEVFGPGIVPKEGITPYKGCYGFSELRKWETALAAPVLSTRGVGSIDIDEVENRVSIGVESESVEGEIALQVEKLGIPSEAVVVQVTPPVTLALHTVQSPFAPRQGGYIVRRLLCNQTGFGISGGTLGFNAFALSMNGNIRGVVTNSHNTAAWWKLDTSAGFPPALFYQAPGYYPSELIGQETIDYAGFQGFPCPTGLTCRYSDSAFITYNPGVTSAHAMIARTTGLTTSINNPVIAVSHTIANDVGQGRWGIAAPPSQPYLVGLTLNKVGSTTGWTQGTIMQTNVTMTYPTPLISVICPGNRLDSTAAPTGATLLSQYVVGHPTNDMVNGGDSGSPVFRISNASLKYVELYGILWGRIGFQQFVFSPIGGSPYQPAGIQTDLGPLAYVGQCLPPSPPCQ